MHSDSLNTEAVGKALVDRPIRRHSHQVILSLSLEEAGHDEAAIRVKCDVRDSLRENAGKIPARIERRIESAVFIQAGKKMPHHTVERSEPSPQNRFALGIDQDCIDAVIWPGARFETLIERATGFSRAMRFRTVPATAVKSPAMTTFPSSRKARKVMGPFAPMPGSKVRSRLPSDSSRAIPALGVVPMELNGPAMITFPSGWLATLVIDPVRLVVPPALRAQRPVKDTNKWR